MKNKTKFLLAFLLIAMLIVLFAISVSAAEPVETWDISATSSDSITAYLYNDPNNSGMYTLTISGTGNMENWISFSSVPWYSSYSSKITSVTIEEGVTSIGNYAFYHCSSLTSIVIPEGVTSIGNYAFYDCSSLTSIVISDGVTSIGNYAFYNCSKLTSIVIPEGVTSIGSGTFYNCSSLTSIVIPEGVTSIGYWAFSDCSSLTSIVIPKSVTSIGGDAFYKCSKLTSIVITDGVTSIGSHAFQYCSSLTSIVIPEGVTSIGYRAFIDCSKLTIYAEAESQPSGWDIGWNYSNRPVVWGHTHTYDNKTDICICGTKVSYVEKWDISATSSDNVTAYLCADPQNSGMYTLTISGTGNMKDWGYGEAPWYSSYGSAITSIIIEKGVRNIGNCAFHSCSKIKSIEIPEGVITIGDSAFDLCYSLTSIEIPKGVTTIGVRAFAYCTGFTSIEIPEGVTTIGNNAFIACENLIGVVLPDGLISIGEMAFLFCGSLTSVIIPESVTTMGYAAFGECYNVTVYCEAERAQDGWHAQWDILNEDGSYTIDVVMGYFDVNACLNGIFTFKGYSFNESGSMAVGFEIDYEAIARYEEKTGEALDFGVVFAGFDALGGNMPLDANGNAHADVVKFSTKGYDYIQYDFVITDMTEEYFDISFVISAYICSGAMTKFVQANGLSDTVTGITYNEAKGA